MKIVCTREEARNRPIIAALAREGLEGISLPLIKTEPTPVSLDERSRLIAAFEDETCTLCFTSPNGVRYAFPIISPLRMAPRCTVAVQGQATAEAWKSLTGFAPSILAQGSTGTDLGKTILAKSTSVRHALLIGPTTPRPELAEVLAQAGVTVDRIAVYRTEACEVSAAMKRSFAGLGKCLVLFFSPSSVRSFVDAELHCVNRIANYASFGPTTASALRDEGLPIALEHCRGEQSTFVAEIAALVRSRVV